MRAFSLFLLLLVSAAGLHAATESEPLPDGLYAEFTTPQGVFTARLLYEKVPMTCASFVGLAEGTIAPRNGKPFFTGLRWYRVVPDFVIQSGDPTFAPDKKDEAVDPGHPYNFPDEFVPGLHHDSAGVLSMANGGPDTNSSEFFLTLRETNRLNYLHSVFGHVVRGLEVLPLIKQDDSFTIKILRIGQKAAIFRADEPAFKILAADAKKYTGAAEPGPAAHCDDPAHFLPRDPPRAQNFNIKLANFERATGRKINLRILAKSPTPDEDARPGAFMHALAAKLGTAKDGVLAAYFVDEDDWRIWIGDDAVPAFLGHPATPQDLVNEGALHNAKTAFLKAAVAQGDADFAAQKKSAPADKQPPPAQRIKLQADAVLDGLIFKLEPK
jgi:cyclophilin family peptidyl-prolyl cis-trans isomerase